jgi:hypothetical protein
MPAQVYQFPRKNEMPLIKWKNSIDFLFNTQGDRAASEYARVFVPAQFWESITAMIKEPK